MAGHVVGTNLSRQKITTYNVLVLIALGLGSITQGYTTSVIGTSLGQPSFQEYFRLLTRSNGTDLTATMTGMFQAGGLIGLAILPWFADQFGRKWACALPAILAVLSGALTSGSVNVGMFIAFRFFAGAASWMMSAVITLTMSEITPVHLRAAMVDISAVMFVLGYVIQNWVGFGFFWWKGTSDTWRPPIAIQCFWGLTLLCILPFLPESPRWLCMKERYDEAEAILLKLHKSPDDPTNQLARVEFYQIRKQLQIDRTLGNSWMHILKKPSYRKRAMIAAGTTVFTQCSGALVINSYGPLLYRTLQYGPVKQLLFPALWMTTALGLNVIAMFLVDRFPRPKYMAFGLFGCMACLSVEAALVAEFVPSTNTAALKAAVAMFFIFIGFYETCVNGTQFCYINELFPTHLRAKGVSIGVGSMAAMNLIWLQSSPIGMASIGWKFYLAFIVPGTIGAFVMWFYFPDTNGLPLEEIAAIFGDEDEVALYQRDLEIDLDADKVVDHREDNQVVIEVRNDTTGLEK